MAAPGAHSSPKSITEPIPRNAPSRRFKHKPLDQSQPSIRLVKVLPLKTPGKLLQCQIFHATTSDEYTCLSYVWGEEADHDGPFEILVNDRKFAVRYNLYGFLDVARAQYAHDVFWIDALCIDQTDTAERNHQVQQMGEIYSRARLVVVWLGMRSSVERVLASLRVAASRRAGLSIVKRITNSMEHGNDKYIRGLAKKTEPRDQEDFNSGLENYWSRAWVTQELALARRVKLLAHRTEWYLPVAFGWSSYRARARLDQSGQRVFTQVQDIATERYEVGGKNLLALLSRLQNRKCSIQRDRIFSLLSLCSEGPRIDVDYGISEARLLCRVMRASKNTLCICSAAVVIAALDLTASYTDGLHHEPLLRADFLEFSIGVINVHPHLSQQSASLVKCDSCLWCLDESWRGKRSTIFCFRSVCSETSGHLVWQHSYPSTEEKTRDNEGLIYYIGASLSEEKRPSKCLGHMGDLVKIADSDDGKSYTIRLTLAALLEVLSDQAFTPSICELSFRNHGFRLLIPEEKGP